MDGGRSRRAAAKDSRALDRFAASPATAVLTAAWLSECIPLTGMTRGLMVCALAASLLAQDSRFDVRSRLVVVPVSVTDLKGRSIDGLEASDFLLFDNGRAQKIAVDTIDTGVAPIALIVAVQSSGISTAALEKV